MLRSTPSWPRTAESFGLPTLDVTIIAQGYEGIPESLEAGRYLLTLSVAADVGEFGGSIEFAQPVGVTADEYIAALAPPPEEDDAAAIEGTPILAPDAMHLARLRVQIRGRRLLHHHAI